MKKSILLIIVVAILIIIATGWYLISPVFNTVEVDEPSPVGINDAMLGMTDEQLEEFHNAVDEANQGEATEMSDSMPSQAGIIAQGNFKERAHSVKGKALIIEQDGNKILRFENFETSNGPNLHIYLSSELGDDDFIDLGKIKATKGNVNYEIPPGTDTDKYNKVLVWCVPFKVLFSYAEVK